MSQRFAVCLAATVMALSGPTEAADSVSRWSSFGSLPGQLASPWGVAARDGRVYVADFDNDRIQVFSRDGVALFTFGSSGRGSGQLRGPAGIALDRDGRVWVADHYNHRIQCFGADGQFRSEWPAGDADAAPLGVAVDALGRVYAGDLASGRIRVWSPDGHLEAEWGGLCEPWGIAHDDAGNLWVADHGEHLIARFGPRGEPRGTLPVATGTLDGPMGLALAADGSLIVSDLAGGRLHRFDLNGTHLGRLENASAGMITGLAVDGAEIFAADGEASQIIRVRTAALVPPGSSSFELGLIRPSPSRGTVTVQLAVPSAGAVAVQVYSIAGRRVWSGPTRSVAAGEHYLSWNGRDERGHAVPAGVYFVRVSFDDGTRRVTRDGRAVVIR